MKSMCIRCEVTAMLKSFLPLLFVGLAACGNGEAPVAEAPVTSEAPAQQDALAASVGGAWRSAEDRARDAWRNPQESLQFWGLAPGMTVLEVGPGGGWWTAILAPYARASGGRYFATGTGPTFADRYAQQADIYGTINTTEESALPADTFDFVLVARAVHGWIGEGVADTSLANLFAATRPGGVLAIEQHRANPGQDDPTAASGYVTEERVIALAEAAGFELAGRSEINANPSDMKDHPFGVWTLPPTRRSRPYEEGPDAVDPNFDRAKYDAIGESDRMTLKFVKPAG